MKTKKLLYLFSMTLLFSACVPTIFYQVYNVKSIQETISKTDEFFFEDENCKISYNLWESGGNIGFNFFNKTDNIIYVKLNQSNFILNGFAYDYFKNRTFTTTKGRFASASNTLSGSVAVTGINIRKNIQTNQVKSSSAASIGSSDGYSVSIEEDSLIRIPPNTTKRVSEYSINNMLIRNCDLLRYPRIKEIKTKLFTAEKSPLVFSNRITYEIKGNSRIVENDFFVSGITNYPESEFFEWKYYESCGKESYVKKKNYKLYDIDKFYIKYSKGTADYDLKH